MDKNGIFHPWQLINFNIKNLIISTTFEEIEILWNKHIRFRPNFDIVDNLIVVPNIVAKINGINTDIKYYNFFSNLLQEKKTIMKESIINSYFEKTKWSKLSFYSNNDNIDYLKFKKSEFYKYQYIREETQQMMFDKLNKLNKELAINKDIKTNDLLWVYINLPEDIINLIIDFDYPQKNPKIIIYNNSKQGFDKFNNIAISYLSKIGFDILIVTPSSFRNYEDFNSNIDIHSLENINIELSFDDFRKKLEMLKIKDKKGFFNKFFK